MWEASVGTGARVHSGSWGFPDEPCTVDEASVSFDTWAYEVRGSLVEQLVLLNHCQLLVVVRFEGGEG